MVMIYLTKTDLIALAFERLIDESSLDFEDLLATVELKNIAVIKTYIGSRYNVDVIFDAINPLRNEVLVGILSNMVLYDVVRRNAARKVPTDYKEDYEKSELLLQKIAFGRLVLSDVPVAIDSQGNPATPIMIGNTSNKNFYI